MITTLMLLFAYWLIAALLFQFICLYLYLRFFSTNRLGYVVVSVIFASIYWITVFYLGYLWRMIPLWRTGGPL